MRFMKPYTYLIEEKRSLTELTEKIKKEYHQNIDKHSQEIIIANIDMILKYWQTIL